MRYCKTCGIWMKNVDLVCPLCQSVLQRVSEKEIQEETQREDLRSAGKFAKQIVSPGYPPVAVDRKKYAFALRVCTFVAIIMMILLFAINYVTYASYNTVWWSLICDVGILYLLLTLRYSIFNGDEGLNAKIAVQCIGVMGLCVLIDFVIGFHGWSFDYALPGIVLLADVGILVLMLVDAGNWQNYILLQLFMLALSVILVLLAIPGLVSNVLLPMIALLITLLLFLGTWIVGGRMAKTELKRRFHI